MNKLNDERQATKPKEKERKKETIHEFIDWLNEKWETNAVPVILVPYKTTMYMARFSHNQQKIWKAMRILVAHRAHQTLDSVSFTCRQRVQHLIYFIISRCLGLVGVCVVTYFSHFCKPRFRSGHGDFRIVLAATGCGEVPEEDEYMTARER